MNKEEIFSIWAPEQSIWSPWVKPVLFAHLDSAATQLTDAEPTGESGWSPPREDKIAIVLDLPGAEGVATGIALAQRGYRPVPLYNAVPMPFGRHFLNPLANLPVAAVDVFPILSALRKGAEELAQLSLPADAPPAFLLDANRHGGGTKMRAGQFDNRSVSFTTDFPSANFFAARGIRRVLLFREDSSEPQPDLAHSLRRWQDSGFVLERTWPGNPQPPARFEIARPSWYGAMFQRALAAVGLRRSGVGGFGAWVPDSSASG